MINLKQMYSIQAPYRISVFFIWFAFLTPMILHGQARDFTGRISDAKTGESIPSASVFITQSSMSTQSDAEGRFRFRNIKPGHYELVVKYVGYETLNQPIVIEEGSKQVELKLNPQTQELKAVVIKADKYRDRNLAIFKREFIGNSEAALSFKFLNPNELVISYTEGELLEAYSKDFLVFENHYLGYRIKFLLNEFTRTFIPGTFGEGVIYHEGSSFFEPMKGSDAKMRRWKRNRLNTYRGSVLHFYRSLIDNTLQSEGFTMYRLIRKDNPDRPSSEMIESKLKSLRLNKTSYNNADSIEYWLNKRALPKQIQYLLKDSLLTRKVFRYTDRPGLYALKFDDNLYVTYKGKGAGRSSSNANLPLTKDGEAVGVISLLDKHVFFDRNGIVANPRKVLYEGYWAGKVPALLPSDYQPGD